MSRFYAPRENVKGNNILIDGDEAHHILAVMRLKQSDKVVVFDGSGKEYTGFIKEAKPKSLIVEIISTKTPRPGSLPEITLVQALPKKHKMDYIIEKATELGVASVIPVVSERTVVKVTEEKAAQKIRRWRKIATAASKQCGRRDIPGIMPVAKFYNVIDSVNDYDLALMACFAEDTVSVESALSEFESGKIIVFIGPEGDFTPAEIAMAGDANCRFISLGPRVLKSDTAGIFLLSVLNYELSR